MQIFHIRPLFFKKKKFKKPFRKKGLFKKKLITLEVNIFYIKK